MYIFSISLALYTMLTIYKTAENLETSYKNKIFNDQYGLEYFEDIEDLTDIFNSYSEYK